MAAENPFGNLTEADAPTDVTSPEFTTFAIQYAAASLWDVMSELPCKSEATLAQRRLEESVFWAKRAARPQRS